MIHPDPTAEAVKAACLTAYHDCRYPGCGCDLVEQVKKALAAFTAAQLAGAGEVERELIEWSNRVKAYTGDTSGVINAVRDFNRNSKVCAHAASTISALRARVAELEAMLHKAEGPVVYHAAKGCKMCKDFLPELHAVILSRSPTPPHERPPT